MISKSRMCQRTCYIHCCDVLVACACLQFKLPCYSALHGVWINCRLRWQIGGGALLLFYLSHRVHSSTESSLLHRVHFLLLLVLFLVLLLLLLHFYLSHRVHSCTEITFYFYLYYYLYFYFYFYFPTSHTEFTLPQREKLNVSHVCEGEG